MNGIIDGAGAQQIAFRYNRYAQPIEIKVPAMVAASGSDEISLLQYAGNSGDLLSTTDPLGNKMTVNAYNAYGDPLSFSAYPDTGDPATSQAPLTSTTTLNAAQMPIQTVAPNGVVGTSTYANGILTQIQTNAPPASGGALLNRLILSTDSRGRVYQIADQGGLIASYKFDKNSNLKSSTDSRGNSTVFIYGANNELTRVLGVGDTNYKYDRGGRLSEYSLYGNKITRYLYNPDDTLAELRTLINGNTLKKLLYTYDDAGRVLSATDWTGSRTYAYDPFRKRLQSITTVISALPAGHNTFTNSYTYFGDGKVASVTTPVGVTAYSYNAGGQIVSMNSPDGSFTSWQFDHIGRTTQRQTHNAAGNTFTVQYHYGGSHYPGDTSTAPYYLDRITNLVNSQTLWDYQIQHNYSGQITAIVGTGQNGRSLSAQYQYDFRGHLLNEQKTYTVDAQHSYTKSSSISYDSAGNRTPTDTNWTYGPFNQLISAPTSGSLPGATGLAYDGAGNLSSMNGMQLAYDAFGSLESITNTPAGNQSFERDGTGHVLHQTIGGVSTYILYEGGVPIAELDNGGNVNVSYNQSPDGLLSDSQNGVVRQYFGNATGDFTDLVNGTTGQTLSEDEYSGTGQSITGITVGASNYNYGGQAGVWNVPGTPLFADRSGSGGYNANTGTGITPGGYYNSDDPSEYSPDSYRQLIPNLMPTIHAGAEFGMAALEFAGYMTPYLGSAMAAHDIATGRSITGRKLSPEERLLLLAALIPWGKVVGYGAKVLPLLADSERALAIAKSMKRGCFVAGTPVTLAGGKSAGKSKGSHEISHIVPIEQVKKGDFVYSRDPKTGKNTLRRVDRTTVRKVDAVLTVSLVNSKTHKVAEAITTTREHPFYVSGKGFVPAGGLAIGNAIVTRAGPPLIVKSLKWHRSADGIKVYNFVVEDDHTYFVGKSNGGIWVHNPSEDCIAIAKKILDKEGGEIYKLTPGPGGRNVARAHEPLIGGKPDPEWPGRNLDWGDHYVHVKDGKVTDPMMSGHYDGETFEQWKENHWHRFEDHRFEPVQPGTLRNMR